MSVDATKEMSGPKERKTEETPGRTGCCGN
jgi:hypothetical protein